jgi:hypothetical protein
MADRLYPFSGSLNKAKGLRQLERAFRRCARAGLVFYGMDDGLTAYSGREIRALMKEHDDPSEAMRHADESHDVDTARAYKDSGGW